MSDAIPVRGQRVQLKLIKESVFPDGQSYYVLEDVAKRRFLLPAEFYRSYGFVAGQDVEAVVGHVNCNGRIFIEPDHPRYQIGTLARFTVRMVVASAGGYMPAVVIDADELEYNVVFPPGIPPPGSRVLLPVRAIRKGRIFLEWPSSPDVQVHTPEFPVQATCQGTYRLMHGEPYHLLVYDHVPALVKGALYPWFHPASGQLVDCLLYGNEHGTWRAEPIPVEYPFGFRMPMKLLRTYTVDDLMRGLKHWAEAVDVFDRQHTIMIGATSFYEPNKMYTFRVSGYKKGRIVWEEL